MMREYHFDQYWSARERHDDDGLEPNSPISGGGIGPQKDREVVTPAVQRNMLEHFGNIKPGEPYFLLEGQFFLNGERPEDLTIAPGAADATFGALMNWLILKSFQRVETLDPNTSHRFYTQCQMCEATDLNRPDGEPPSVNRIAHTPTCILAKHLLRLHAMATKGI